MSCACRLMLPLFKFPSWHLIPSGREMRVSCRLVVLETVSCNSLFAPFYSAAFNLGKAFTANCILPQRKEKHVLADSVTQGLGAPGAFVTPNPSVGSLAGAILGPHPTLINFNCTLPLSLELHASRLNRRLIVNKISLHTEMRFN